VVALHSDMEANPQVGQQLSDAIVDNLNSTFVGIDVGLNQQRA
jgi:hypothetical protein